MILSLPVLGGGFWLGRFEGLVVSGALNVSEGNSPPSVLLSGGGVGDQLQAAE